MEITFDDLSYLSEDELNLIHELSLRQLYRLQESKDNEAIARWTIIEASCKNLLKQ